MPKAAARPLRVGDKVKNLDDGQIGTVMYIPRSVELTDTVVVRFGRSDDGLCVPTEMLVRIR